MQPETNLKPIPHDVERSKLYVLYNSTSRKNVDDALDHIISKTRLQLKLTSATNIRKLLHIEWVEFVSMFLPPKGYYITSEFQKSLDTLQFRNNLISIVSQNIENCCKEIIAYKKEKPTENQLQLFISKSCFKHNVSQKTIETILKLNNHE